MKEMAIPLAPARPVLPACGQQEKEKRYLYLIMAPEAPFPGHRGDTFFCYIFCYQFGRKIFAISKRISQFPLSLHHTLHLTLYRQVRAGYGMAGNARFYLLLFFTSR
jgi:hypothetical protein